MKALIVYCHPSEGSFNHAVLETVKTELNAVGAEHRTIDLYGENFQPVLTLEDWTEYEDTNCNTARITGHVDLLTWCDSLIFVYPTWWFGLPAILKGWLDRVLVPGVAFSMPTKECPRISHNFLHIKNLAVFTTCGASFWFTKFVGSPGKRMLMRGLRSCLNRRARMIFAAHYQMDSSTPETRAKHLTRVSQKMRRLTGKRTLPPGRPAFADGVSDTINDTMGEPA
ncbi:MAG: NAD(P)H-dependent oxidoreductase [Pseudomonadota bacterium]